MFNDGEWKLFSKNDFNNFTTPSNLHYSIFTTVTSTFSFWHIEWNHTWWRHQMKTFSALLAICAVNSPVPGEFPAEKGKWQGVLMLSLICTRINGWVNSGEAGDLRSHRAHYEVIVMYIAWNSLHRQIGSNCTCWMHNVGVQSGFRGSEWKSRSPVNAWWRHQMETFSALLAICAGNSPVPGEFPAQRPVTWTFDVFFDMCLNKRLSKQW